MAWIPTGKIKKIYVDLRRGHPSVWTSTPFGRLFVYKTPQWQWQATTHTCQSGRTRCHPSKQTYKCIEAAGRYIHPTSVYGMIHLSLSHFLLRIVQVIVYVPILDGPREPSISVCLFLSPPSSSLNWRHTYINTQCNRHDGTTKYYKTSKKLPTFPTYCCTASRFSLVCLSLSLRPLLPPRHIDDIEILRLLAAQLRNRQTDDEQIKTRGWEGLSLFLLILGLFVLGRPWT